MSDTIRIKRRVSGGAGPPSALANAELAYNEVSNTLYYGKGDDGAGQATSVIPIGGGGAFQPVDPDLTAIAALTGTNVFYYRSAANTWAAVSIGANLSFTGGTLAATVTTGPTGPQGPAGPTGPQGTTGAQGPQGPQGTTGAQGAAGTGITMKGSVATSGNLPATGNTQGDAYIVQADDSLWIWNGTAWVSGGSIQGPPGATGSQGPQGTAGAQGPTGAQGPQGDPGPTGAQGPTGPAGVVTANAPLSLVGSTLSIDLSAYATNAAVAAGYQPLDGDLTALAALAGTNTIYYRSAANTWSPVTFSGLTFTGGVLTATGGGTGNVSNSGTPNANEVAQWVTSTTIKGVPLATWRTNPDFFNILTVRSAAGGDGVNLRGLANQGWVYSEGAAADVSLVLSSKGNAAITFYNGNFTRICAQFTSAPGANTFPTFTGNVGFSGLANNPTGNPIVMGSDLQLTTGSTAVTQTAGDNSTKIATTAFVTGAAGGSKSGAFAVPSANQTGIANETFTKIAFGNATVNDGSLFNTTTSRWTPPAGKCFIAARAYFTGVLVGTPIALAVYKNGTLAQQNLLGASADYGSGNINYADLASGTDYYEIFASVMTSATATITAASSQFMGFQI